MAPGSDELAVLICIKKREHYGIKWKPNETASKLPSTIIEP